MHQPTSILTLNTSAFKLQSF